MLIEWRRAGVQFTATSPGAGTKAFRPLRQRATAGTRSPGGAWQARGWRGRWIRMGDRVQITSHGRRGTAQSSDTRGNVTVRWDDGATTAVPGSMLQRLAGPATAPLPPARTRAPHTASAAPAAASASAPIVDAPHLADLIPRHGGQPQEGHARAAARAGLARLLEGRTYGDGYTVTVDDVATGTHTPASGGGHYVRFTVTIRAADGSTAGKSTRKLVREPDGTLWADHEYQVLDLAHRGRGFGSSWNHHLERLYRQDGFDRIELFASEDDGGYMWAAAGYDFANEWSAAAVIDNLKRELADLEWARDSWPGTSGDPALQQILDDIAMLDEVLADARAGYGRPGFPAAHRISQLGRRPGMKYRRDEWLGSRVMAGTEWEGVLPL
ncbi:hypothetical protein ETD86_12835 [Nonomuraea turkmeniaca]|uniref:Uncharacterized protein n=1 Tax=Nonomuraea turkmeniaca TaxID=103838 RepID=A0A5S4FMZ6_9ACTN|nr:hypothetical protein [Nonomuraea turkmeniaca]TMR22052.1 hypothetical protein ETD86_12835 [Nonomuraea turkmeniaca]